MKLYTVKQVAKLAGISVRALHHYDEIGLLKPALIGNNRYRYYGRDELLRLQQILLHRELDIPLGDIAAIIDQPGFDRLGALQTQRAHLLAQAKRTAVLIETIDRTIAHLKGERPMSHAELYNGITAEKQAEYERWLIDTYGGDMPERIARSKKAFGEMSPTEREAAMAELVAVEGELVAAMRHGVAADSTALAPLLQRHRDWVSAMWDRPCPPEAYAGLADLHLSHPDFVARYDGLASGFSDYHAAAMKAHAGRQWARRIRAATATA